MSKKIYLPVDESEGKDVVSLCGRCYERVGPSEIKPNTFNASDAPESCCQCKTIWIKVPKLITDDPLDPETEFKRVPAPRCIFLAENANWNWGDYDAEDPPVWHGLPLLLKHVTPTGEYNDPDTISYEGSHIFTAKQFVTKDSSLAGTYTGDDWYTGNTYQMAFAVTYNCRTMKAKLSVNTFCQGTNAFTWSIGPPSKDTCPSGGITYASVPVVGLTTPNTTAKTNAFRGLGGSISFAHDEQEQTGSQNLMDGITLDVPALGSSEFIGADELTPDCFVDKLCAMVPDDAYGLLNVNSVDESLLTIGVNWWYLGQPPSLNVLEPYRVFETLSGVTWQGDNVLTESDGTNPYFVGAYRTIESLEAPPDYIGPDILVTRATQPSPIWRPFFYDPEVTYDIEIDLLSTYAAFDGGGPISFWPNNGWPGPYDVMFFMTGCFSVDAFLYFPKGGGTNVQTAHALSGQPGFTELAAVPGDTSHIPPGLHTLHVKVEPDPDNCEKIRITKTGPAGTITEYQPKPYHCELQYLIVKGKDIHIVDDFVDFEQIYPNNVVHYGFSNLKITTSQPYRRPKYDLCKFTRFNYPAPYHAGGEVDGSYDWTFYRCNEVLLDPVIKEVDRPIDLKIVCGEVPDGIVFYPATGRFKGTIDKNYSGPTDGHVSVRMWDGKLAYILTRKYYWIVKLVTALSVDYDTPYHNTGPAPSPGLPAVDFVYRAGPVSQLPNFTGDHPLEFSIVSGTLPNRLKIVTKTGEIRPIGTSFTPDENAPETGSFSVEIRNKCGDAQASTSYSWRVEFPA